jgi:hypothetical protein
VGNRDFHLFLHGGGRVYFSAHDQTSLFIEMVLRRGDNDATTRVIHIVRGGLLLLGTGQIAPPLPIWDRFPVCGVVVGDDGTLPDRQPECPDKANSSRTAEKRSGAPTAMAGGRTAVETAAAPGRLSEIRATCASIHCKPKHSGMGSFGLFFVNR